MKKPNLFRPGALHAGALVAAGSLFFLVQANLQAGDPPLPPPDIDWWTIDAGAPGVATGTGSNNTLAGSIGQPDAGIISWSTAKLYGGYLVPLVLPVPTPTPTATPSPTTPSPTTPSPTTPAPCDPNEWEIVDGATEPCLYVYHNVNTDQMIEIPCPYSPCDPPPPPSPTPNCEVGTWEISDHMDADPGVQQECQDKWVNSTTMQVFWFPCGEQPCPTPTPTVTPSPTTPSPTTPTPTTPTPTTPAPTTPSPTTPSPTTPAPTPTPTPVAFAQSIEVGAAVEYSGQLDGNGFGQSITYALVATPAKGEALVDADGSFTYTSESFSTNQHDSFTFRVNDGANYSSPAAVDVSIVALGDPEISITPQILEFDHFVIQNGPKFKPFAVANSGGGMLNYSISSSESWLTANVTTGAATSESDTIIVTVNPTGLALGSNNGTLTISSSEAENSPVELTVSVDAFDEVASPSITAEPVEDNRVEDTVAPGEWKYYEIEIPEGTESIDFDLEEMGVNGVQIVISDDGTQPDPPPPLPTPSKPGKTRTPYVPREGATSVLVGIFSPPSSDGGGSLSPASTFILTTSFYQPSDQTPTPLPTPTPVVLPPPCSGNNVYYAFGDLDHTPPQVDPATTRGSFTALGKVPGVPYTPKVISQQSHEFLGSAFQPLITSDWSVHHYAIWQFKMPIIEVVKEPGKLQIVARAIPRILQGDPDPSARLALSVRESIHGTACFTPDIVASVGSAKSGTSLNVPDLFQDVFEYGDMDQRTWNIVADCEADFDIQLEISNFYQGQISTTTTNADVSKHICSSPRDFNIDLNNGGRHAYFSAVTLADVTEDIGPFPCLIDTRKRVGYYYVAGKIQINDTASVTVKVAPTDSSARREVAVILQKWCGTLGNCSDVRTIVCDSRVITSSQPIILEANGLEPGAYRIICNTDGPLGLRVETDSVEPDVLSSSLIATSCASPTATPVPTAVPTPSINSEEAVELLSGDSITASTIAGTPHYYFFKAERPAGRINIEMTNNSSGVDNDLLVRKIEVPTDELWDFRPNLPGASPEIVWITTTSDPPYWSHTEDPPYYWFIMVNPSSAGSYTLKVNYFATANPIPTPSPTPEPEEGAMLKTNPSNVFGAGDFPEIAPEADCVVDGHDSTINIEFAGYDARMPFSSGDTSYTVYSPTEEADKGVFIPLNDDFDLGLVDENEIPVPDYKRPPGMLPGRDNELIPFRVTNNSTAEADLKIRAGSRIVYVRRSNVITVLEAVSVVRIWQVGLEGELTDVTPAARPSEGEDGQHVAFINPGARAYFYLEGFQNAAPTALFQCVDYPLAELDNCLACNAETNNASLHQFELRATIGDSLSTIGSTALGFAEDRVRLNIVGCDVLVDSNNDKVLDDKDNLVEEISPMRLQVGETKPVRVSAIFGRYRPFPEGAIAKFTYAGDGEISISCLGYRPAIQSEQFAAANSSPVLTRRSLTIPAETESPGFDPTAGELFLTGVKDGLLTLAMEVTARDGVVLRDSALIKVGPGIIDLDVDTLNTNLDSFPRTAEVDALEDAVDTPGKIFVVNPVPSTGSALAIPTKAIVEIDTSDLPNPENMYYRFLYKSPIRIYHDDVLRSDGVFYPVSSLGEEIDNKIIGDFAVDLSSTEAISKIAGDMPIIIELSSTNNASGIVASDRVRTSLFSIRIKSVLADQFRTFNFLHPDLYRCNIKPGILSGDTYNDGPGIIFGCPDDTADAYADVEILPVSGWGKFGSFYLAPTYPDDRPQLGPVKPLDSRSIFSGRFTEMKWQAENPGTNSDTTLHYGPTGVGIGVHDASIPYAARVYYSPYIKPFSPDTDDSYLYKSNYPMRAITQSGRDALIDSPEFYEFLLGEKAHDFWVAFSTGIHTTIISKYGLTTPPFPHVVPIGVGTDALDNPDGFTWDADCSVYTDKYIFPDAEASTLADSMYENPAFLKWLCDCMRRDNTLEKARDYYDSSILHSAQDWIIETDETPGSFPPLGPNHLDADRSLGFIIGGFWSDAKITVHLSRALIMEKLSVSGNIEDLYDFDSGKPATLHASSIQAGNPTLVGGGQPFFLEIPIDHFYSAIEQNPRVFEDFLNEHQ